MWCAGVFRSRPLRIKTQRLRFGYRNFHFYFLPRKPAFWRRAVVRGWWCYTGRSVAAQARMMPTTNTAAVASTAFLKSRISNTPFFVVRCGSLSPPPYHIKRLLPNSVTGILHLFCNGAEGYPLHYGSNSPRLLPRKPASRAGFSVGWASLRLAGCSPSSRGVR